MAEKIDVDEESGFTRITTPTKPRINPKTCFVVTDSFNHKNAIIIVLKAVVAFNIAKIFESAPKLAYENKTNGIALLVNAKRKECFHADLNKIRYFFLNSKGVKTREATISLDWTKPIAPNSGAAILIKIKALPQIAPRNVKTIQYFVCINGNKKPPNKLGVMN